jgi:NADH-quinone oxidoreductase subunit G
VLGNLLGLQGFEQENINAVREEIAPDLQSFISARLNNGISGIKVDIPAAQTGIERIAEVPIYAADSLVRHASSLQKTADAATAKRILLAAELAGKLGIVDGMDVCIKQDGRSVILTAGIDKGLARDCVRVAAALPETAPLGPMSGSITLEKAAMAAAAD